MIGTKEIKRRIRGVTNIQQITRAMEMVAASRLKRAQSRAEASRPYFSAIKSLMEDLLSWSTESGIRIPESSIQDPASNKIALVLITSDKGLCGAYIANVVRQAQQFIRKHSEQETTLITIGKRGDDFFRRRGYNIHAFHSLPSKEVTQRVAQDVSHSLLEDYGKKYHELHLLYSRFVSATKSNAVFLQLLPLGEHGEKKTSDHTVTKRKIEPSLEPDAEIMVENLLPQYITAQIYGAMSESLASEQGARMVAMRSASDNAEEMLENLTLRYNKARQATITTELLEVVTGAEALREN